MSDDPLDDFDELFASLQISDAPKEEPPPAKPIPATRPASAANVVPRPKAPLAAPPRAARHVAPVAPPPVPHAFPPLELDEADAAAPTPQPAPRSPTRTTDPLLGKTILGFRVLSFVGSGSSSRVYKAESAEGVPAAIKVLNPEFRNNQGMHASFLREAEVTDSLAHPSVLRVFGCGKTDDGSMCLAIEYFDGVPLASLTSMRAPVPYERAVHLMLQVVSALGALHHAGYVHRDVNPENVLFHQTPEGDDVKLCDFGHAAEPDERAEPSLSAIPDYMAPELAEGISADARSDIYACGVILFELLTGALPVGDSPSIRALVPDVSSVLEEIVLRAISKNANERHSSANELFEELRVAIEPEITLPLDFDVHPLKKDTEHLKLVVQFIARTLDQSPGNPSKEELGALTTVLAHHGEITFARNDTREGASLAILSGHGEVGELQKILGSEFSPHGARLVAFAAKYNVAAFTLREGSDQATIRAVAKAARAGERVPTEFATRATLLTTSDIISRGRGLSWKVGIAISRLAADLIAASRMRGANLQASLSFQQELIERIIHLLAQPNEFAQLLANADLIDTRLAQVAGKTLSTLENLASTAPAVDLALAGSSLLNDFSTHPEREARAFSAAAHISPWISNDSSVESRKLLAELYRRSLLPPNVSAEHVTDILYAEATADELSRDPSPQLDLLDNQTDRAAYAKALGELELAVELLVDRGETSPLVQVILTVQRHADQPSTRAEVARRDIAKEGVQRLLRPSLLSKIALSVLNDPDHLSKAATKALLIAKADGASALLRAHSRTPTDEQRARFSAAMKAFGPHAFEVLRTEISELDAEASPSDILRIEDLLNAVPDAPDDMLAEAIAPLTALPHLATVALRACARLSPLIAKPRLCLAVSASDPKLRAMAIEELGRHDLIDDSLLPLVFSVFETHEMAAAPARQAAAVALGHVKKALAPKVFAQLVEVSGAGKSLLNRLVSRPKDVEHPEVLLAIAQSLARLDRHNSEGPIKRLANMVEGATRDKILKLAK